MFFHLEDAKIGKVKPPLSGDVTKTKDIFYIE